MDLDFSSVTVKEPSSSALAPQSARPPNPFRYRKEIYDYDNPIQKLGPKSEPYIQYVSPRQVASENTYYSARNKIKPTSRSYEKCPYQRPMLTNEKLADKRDTYIIQMILNKKKKHITNYEELMEKGEQELQDWCEKITEESHECTRRGDQIEADLLRARKNTEQVLMEKAALQKLIKQKQIDNHVIENEIYKNQDTIELYKRYKRFIEDVCPKDQDYKEYLANPSILSNILDSLEKDNIFADKEKNQLSDLEQLKANDNSSQINELDGKIAEIDAKFNKMKPVAQIERSEESEQRDKAVLDKVESEIDYLTQLVLDLYIDFFGQKVILTPVEMLQRVEEQLETFYTESKKYTLDSLINLQNQIDKARREEDKRKRMEEHEKLILEKREAAIQRANKVIKKRVGRKLMERYTINKNAHKTEEQLYEAQKEKERMENLLFGSDFEM